MQRTQIYLDDQLRRDLQSLAKREDKSMAEIARGILREGVAKKKKIDTSGVAVLQKLVDMKITGGDDPNLSSNIDHYLYGAPKRKP